MLNFLLIIFGVLLYKFVGRETARCAQGPWGAAETIFTVSFWSTRWFTVVIDADSGCWLRPHIVSLLDVSSCTTNNSDLCVRPVVISIARYFSSMKMKFPSPADRSRYWEIRFELDSRSIQAWFDNFDKCTGVGLLDGVFKSWLTTGL